MNFDKELVNEFLEYMKTCNEAEKGSFDYIYIIIQHPDQTLSLVEIQWEDYEEGNIKLLETGLTVDDTYVNGYYFALSYDSIFFLTTDFDTIRDQFGFPETKEEDQ